MTGRTAHAQTEVFPQPLGTDEDLSAADAMKSEPETAAGKTETGSNQPSATAIAESPVSTRVHSEADGPGGLIHADFRNMASGVLPAGWNPRFKNVMVQGRPETALVLIDPARAERITLPHADLTGDFTIDLEFALPVSTTVQLHLQAHRRRTCTRVSSPMGSCRSTWRRIIVSRARRSGETARTSSGWSASGGNTASR